MIPFIWEGENYLLKLKSDLTFLARSSFTRYFNFSLKSDPFLVYPSIKHTRVTGRNKNMGRHTIPIQNHLMKVIRQSEVYLMEEAVTESLIQEANTLLGLPLEKLMLMPRQEDPGVINVENFVNSRKQVLAEEPVAEKVILD
jgi:hypothetical protein